MASFRGHLTLATALGSGYGSIAAWHFGLDWGPVFLGAGLTALGGFLPDLDSDSGVPVREVFGVAAATTPFLVFDRFRTMGLSLEQTIVVLVGLYLLVRYGLALLFKMLTVHRGMFHSIPAMFIAGLAVFVVYDSSNLAIRLFLAGGVVIGFLSHLLLDEVCSVDFNGAVLQLNQSAGSAFKFFSSSWGANLATYAVLAGLGYVASLEVRGQRLAMHKWPDQVLRILPR
jgi:LexA-binding, inner membrane-associated putative hydrolase